MQVSAFTPIHLVFLELDTHHFQLDFNLLGENNKVIILSTFYLQLLNKDWLYTITAQTYSDLKPAAQQDPQSHRLKKLIEIEAFLLDETEVCESLAEKIKRFNTITIVIDVGGIGLRVGITLNGTSFFSCNSNYTEIL